MREPALFARHTLVWVRPESRASVAAQISDDGIRSQVDTWLTADRPLVVARRPCGEVFSITIPVGLALPPAQGKARIALDVAASDIARHALPLKLSDAIRCAPAEWQPALTELDDTAKDIGIGLRVFGSLAWQALSGLPYLTLRSDIDLLWQPQSRAQLQQGLALLARWERSSGIRADGEVLFGGGSAVSWREWLVSQTGEETRVLVKRASSAELVETRELLEMLA